MGKSKELIKLFLISGLVISIAPNSIDFQEIITNLPNTKTEQLDDGYYLNIKNQIVKEFFAKYDPAKLKIILDMLGCRDASCPALIDITNNDFNIVTSNSYRKELIAVRDRQNKTVAHTNSTILTNDATHSEQQLSTEFQSWNVMQYYQVNVSKTGYIQAIGTKEFAFTSNFTVKLNFTKNDSEIGGVAQSATIFAQPQSITLKPRTKVNATFVFYRYEIILDYFLGFKLDESTAIKHPGVDGAGNVVFIKTPLIPFLTANIDFVKNMKFDHPDTIKLVWFEQIKGFYLTNFPTVEIITNFGIDVAFGNPEPIDPPPESLN